MSAPSIDPAWLSDHGREIAFLYRDVRALSLSPAAFHYEVVARVMALATPPPGGRDTAVLIAWTLRTLEMARSAPSRQDPASEARQEGVLPGG